MMILNQRLSAVNSVWLVSISLGLFDVTAHACLCSQVAFAARTTSMTRIRIERLRLNARKSQSARASMTKQNRSTRLVRRSNAANAPHGRILPTIVCTNRIGHVSFSTCVRGQFRCNSDRCNKSSVVCANNLVYTETSLVACPKTCANHLIWKNCHKYRPGCDCPKNMIRDENVSRTLVKCSRKIKRFSLVVDKQMRLPQAMFMQIGYEGIALRFQNHSRL